ncbi:membrane protein [Fervidicella metallireducens AeB]|uniref:Membrane protein n=1 Tax=Fervidicella metallireducens AeB TaxID=1403537 RepID=A0A017RV53_9CLOT|nr:zinc ribbon domain-containing protein [Fervidicella metallireducens]EYE87795.1 membrane protein [Fervidicella metallireducens AeB]
MKSIKPGRGPSALGLFGSIAAVILGLFWIISAIRMGAPVTLWMFGVVFIIIAIAQGVFHYTNAVGKNRMSLYDITNSYEEEDPIERYIKHDKPYQDFEKTKSYSTDEMKFCPYCGASVKRDFTFCPNCGRDISGDI